MGAFATRVEKMILHSGPSERNGYGRKGNLSRAEVRSRIGIEGLRLGSSAYVCSGNGACIFGRNRVFFGRKDCVLHYR